MTAADFTTYSLGLFMVLWNKVVLFSEANWHFVEGRWAKKRTNDMQHRSPSFKARSTEQSVKVKYPKCYKH